MAVLNTDDETFLVHVTGPAEPITMLIHPSCQTKVAVLMSKETEIPAGYSNFFDVFSLDFATKLPEHIRINDYLINLLDDKQPPYSRI